MSETTWQIIGLSLLLLAVSAAEIRLQQRQLLGLRDRMLRVVVLTTTAGGAIGALPWWQAVPWSFSWILPPLAFRFLAAAGIAFTALGLVALLRPTVCRNKQFFFLLFLYLAPLAAAILTLHLDRFDLSRPIVLAFFSVVLLLVIGSLAGMIRLGVRIARPQNPGDLLISGVLLIWGGLLFLWPQGPLPLIWPWATDPLTTRLIAAMFLTVGAAPWVSKTPDSNRSAQVLALIYGAGIVLSSGLNLLQSKPAPLAYLALWAVIAGWSALRLRQR